MSKIGGKATAKNSVQCTWGDAFESIKKVEDNKYDKIFVDLNDDQYCIDLAAKNIDSLKRILKPNGTITAQVGSQDKKPTQVKKWLNLFQKSFGNTSLDRIYIPSFDCSGILPHLKINKFFFKFKFCEILPKIYLEGK